MAGLSHPRGGPLRCASLRYVHSNPISAQCVHSERQTREFGNVPCSLAVAPVLLPPRIGPSHRIFRLRSAATTRKFIEEIGNLLSTVVACALSLVLDTTRVCRCGLHDGSCGRRRRRHGQVHTGGPKGRRKEDRGNLLTGTLRRFDDPGGPSSPSGDMVGDIGRWWYERW